jgi:Na+(H+)/acetate symporter ActP
VLVALVIPLLFPNGNVWFLVAAAIGLVTNAIQMGVLLGIWTLVRRFKH